MNWSLVGVVRDRLVCGLSRLTETNELVGLMQSELLALGPEIEQKAKVNNCCLIFEDIETKNLTT